jgi:hypothetical protein
MSRRREIESHYECISILELGDFEVAVRAELRALWKVVDAADAYTKGGNHTALFDALDAYHNEGAK